MGVVRVASGNFLEAYDFFVYGYFAVYIARAFFPTGNEFSSLMLSLGTFAAGFLARPLGAIILGSYIDRKGRRAGLDPDARPDGGRHHHDRVHPRLRHHRAIGAADGRRWAPGAGVLGGRRAWRRLGLPRRDRDTRATRASTARGNRPASRSPSSSRRWSASR